MFVTGTSKSINEEYDFVTIKYSQPIGIRPISSEIPSHFSLSQNYPNPFNPVAKIQFGIPVGTRRGAFLQLRVYDLLGREVATLVNEQLSPGEYEVEWDASNYSSGVYYYRISAGDFWETKKMILLK